MREKLIELIRKVDKEDHESRTQDEHYGFMADRLMESGVTIPVRCKDCVSFVPESITVCRHCAITKMQVVDEDDFCSYGERRTDE